MMYCSVSPYKKDVTAHTYMALFLLFFVQQPTSFSFFKMFFILVGIFFCMSVDKRKYRIGIFAQRYDAVARGLATRDKQLVRWKVKLEIDTLPV